MAKYPKYSKRVNKKFVITSISAVVLAGGMLAGFLVARDRNVQMGVEGPTPENLIEFDNLGKDSASKPSGTTGLEHGKQEAEDAFNAVTGQNPSNSDASLVKNLLDGTLTFEYLLNGAPVTDVYTFDKTNNTYTLNQMVDITLQNGKTFTTTNTYAGYFRLENDAIKLFESDGLNAGDSVLGSNSQSGNQYSNIIYVAQDGNIYATITGEAIPGVSSVNTQTPTPTV